MAHRDFSNLLFDFPFGAKDCLGLDCIGIGTRILSNLMFQGSWLLLEECCNGVEVRSIIGGLIGILRVSCTLFPPMYISETNPTNVDII